MPFVQLDFRLSSGSWKTISAALDTGAVISVFSRSTAELLEIDATAGVPVDLVNVGGDVHRYFVHSIWARLGDGAERRMRIAIADSEDVPNLLGRVDVLEGLIITLDGAAGITTISTASPANP